MSSTNAFDIHYVSKLARLELSESEQARFTAQLEKILDYFQTLQEVDTDGVEPTAHATPLFDVIREDVPGQPLTLEAALRNAPQQTEHQVVVPRVVE